MAANRLVAGLTALLLPIALTACGRAVAASAPARQVGSAPASAYAVGVRTLDLGRGTARLPVTIWYPTPPGPSGPPSPPGLARASSAPTEGDKPQRNAPVAAGQFPLVLFSHGLHSLPERHTELTSRWAAAGFVVAAPAYPHTKLGARKFDRGDVRHQPGYAWQVIHRLTQLHTVRGDPFAGHLDVTRIAAAGHSAGGFTTAGMFSVGHSDRLRAGIVIAGGGMARGFAGPAAALLFVHGDADRTVSVASARAAYDRVRWPKAFLTLTGQGHGEYLTPGRAGFDQSIATTTDFLRWALYGDAAARRRIPTDARCVGVTEFADLLN